MAGEANVWQPKTTVEFNADTKSVDEKLVATVSQSLFTLTTFTYAVGTGSLEIHKNGLLLTKGTDWSEQTTSTFAITSSVLAGDIIVATGRIANTANVDVRDTDIYIANYQAIRDYAGTETTLYALGQANVGDLGQKFFQLLTGQAIGFYVDDDENIIVTTGGNGTAAWVGVTRRTVSLDTLALAKASLLVRAGDAVNVAGYYAEGDGGEAFWDVVPAATYTVSSIIFDVFNHDTLPVQLKLRLSTSIYPLQWGALSDGTVSVVGTDNSPIVRAMVNTKLQVEFALSNGYYDFLTTIEKDSMYITGSTVNRGTKLRFQAVDGTALFKTNEYNIDGRYSTFKNFELSGLFTNNSAVTVTGIFLTNPNREDIDTYVENCRFSGLQKSIHIKGRGLYVDRCDFDTTEEAIYLDRTIPVIEGTGDDQKIATGFRAYTIRNSRFHSMSNGNCIANTEVANTARQYLKGIVFTGNFIDSNAIIMNGPCADSMFTGNTHIYGHALNKLFFTDLPWRNVTISGNTFAALATGPTNSPRFIETVIEATDNIVGLSFTGNTIFNLNREFLKITGDLTLSTITGNVFNNALIDSDTNLTRLVEVSGLASRVVMTDNMVQLSVSAVPSNLDFLVNIVGTATDCYFYPNAYNDSLMKASNKNAALVGSVVQTITLKQPATVTRSDTAAAPQLLLSQDITKKSNTSKLVVTFYAVLEGLALTDLPNLEFQYDGVDSGINHFFDQHVGRERGAIIEEKTGAVLNVKILITDGTGAAQNFDVTAESILVIQEVEV